MLELSFLQSLLQSQPGDLPLFKPVALELLQLLAEQETNYFRVIHTIKEDQGLSAHVLTMANSPSYAGRGRCETIDSAAIRLGTQQIANIAIAAAHASLHTSDNPVFNDVMQNLWLHSHACALGCRSIAMRYGSSSIADHAYMAGLLHDIGKLCLLKLMELQCRTDAMPQALGYEIITEVFAELHVEVGCRVMERLNIPEIYCNIVAGHHDKLHDSADMLMTIVRLVNHNSRKFQLSRYPTGTNPEAAGAEETITLDEAAVDKLQTVMTGCCER